MIGNRRAPVALARDAPVAQAPHHLLVAQALGAQVGGDGVGRLGVGQAVVLARIDAGPVFGVLGPPWLGHGIARRSADHAFDRQAIFQGEGVVALVMPRHAHHRAFAVAHQHVIADPHRDLFARDRMGHREAGGHAFLFLQRDIGFLHAAALALFDESRELPIVPRGMGRERMLGRDGAEGHAHDGVGARGEYLEQLLFAVDGVGKAEIHAVALADPVGLHGLHPLGPAGQRAEGGEQFLGVSGDLHVVHRDLALFHQRAGAPAAAVDDLLVGEHGLVHRIPVDRAGLQVHQPFFEHAQEQPLVPLVVLGPAGGDFARPVQGETQRLELLLHVGDVVVGPLGRRHAVGHRGVLGRQPECVPAHGLQHVAAAHAVKARERVADGVVAHVPHVQFARGIGEHRQAIVFRTAARSCVLSDGSSTARNAWVFSQCFWAARSMVSAWYWACMGVSLCGDERIIQARPSIQRKPAAPSAGKRAAALETRRRREISGRPQPSLR